jgi:transcriptional regulator with XRE-family HTH domain
MASLRKAFGTAVRRLRTEQGFSQENFAHHCHVARTYMTAIEKGDRNVSLDLIERIADGLRLSTCELFAVVEQERTRS